MFSTMKAQRWATGAIVAGGLIFTAVSVGAQPAASSSADNTVDEQHHEQPIDETDFKAVYLRGRRRAKAGDTRGALEDYRLAYRLSQGNLDWKVLGNFGNVLLSEGQFVEAAGILRDARQRLPPTDPHYASYSSKLDRRISEAKEHIGEVLITAEPAGTTILIDNRRVGVAPLRDSVFVSPGKHIIKVVQVGLGSESLAVQIAAKERKEVTLVISGVHDGTWRLPAGATVGTLGLAGLATGIGLFVASSSAADDVLRYQQQVDDVPNVDNPCGGGGVVEDGCLQLDTAAGKELTFRSIGIAGMVAGGVLLATGATLLLWPEGDEGDVEKDGGDDDAAIAPQLHIQPWVGSALSGLSVKGTF